MLIKKPSALIILTLIIIIVFSSGCSDKTEKTDVSWTQKGSEMIQTVILLILSYLLVMVFFGGKDMLEEGIQDFFWNAIGAIFVTIIFIIIICLNTVLL